MIYMYTRCEVLNFIFDSAPIRQVYWRISRTSVTFLWSLETSFPLIKYLLSYLCHEHLYMWWLAAGRCWLKPHRLHPLLYHSSKWTVLTTSSSLFVAPISSAGNPHLSFVAHYSGKQRTAVARFGDSSHSTWHVRLLTPSSFTDTITSWTVWV